VQVRGALGGLAPNAPLLGAGAGGRVSPGLAVGPKRVKGGERVVRGGGELRVEFGSGRRDGYRLVHNGRAAVAFGAQVCDHGGFGRIVAVTHFEQR